jgi:myo-inositol-1(or 4)-monophosphatase
MQNEREIVEGVVLEAGSYIREKFGGAISVDLKGEINLVTDVDRESEAIITNVLRKAFPRDDILAEETGASTKGQNNRRWLVDPLDGTTNFAHAYPFVSVSVALEADGDICLGVVYDPLREELFTAENGQRAKLNGAEISVSENRNLGSCLISTGFPYDIKEHPEGHMEDLGRILAATQGIIRDGSAALDLCYVACGRFDGYYERKLSPWDTAAGKLIVKEAGGKVSDFSGGPYSVYGKEILATNGLIHEALSEILG